MPVKGSILILWTLQIDIGNYIMLYFSTLAVYNAVSFDCVNLYSWKLRLYVF